MEAYLFHKNDKRQIPDHFSTVATDIDGLCNIPDSSLNKVTVAGSYFDESGFVEILKKVRHQGTVTFYGPDVYEISRSMLSGHLSGKSTREVIADNEKLYSIVELIELVNQIEDFEVVYKRINHYRYALTIKRR